MTSVRGNQIVGIAEVFALAEIQAFIGADSQTGQAIVRISLFGFQRYQGFALVGKVVSIMIPNPYDLAS